jgi:pyruvate/2-oxoglutarate dehydrogenase complex dihydrolipoamide dehydrogenase (E3) component
MSTSYDAIVIGSGQGGNPLAHKLADADWSVALVEREHLGGTCVNYGCTPTKTMVASARTAHVARRAADFGVRAGPVDVRLDEVVARKDEVVRQWRQSQQDAVAERPTLDLYWGHARFTGPHTVDVDGTTLESDRIVINVGTRPRTPDLDGLDGVEYLTNRTILDVTEQPEHLLVLGGSYIGLEFGQMFRRFGSRVTVLDRNDHIVHREDPEVSDTLQEALEAEGMTFHLATQAQRVVQDGDYLALTLADADGRTRTLTGSHLLVAAGRTPNTDDLGLDAAGVATDERGYVETDEHLQTSVDGIWVLGDAKGGPQFTHISYNDHFVVLDQFTGAGERTVAERQVPYALYTDPELGRVGLTEQAARDAGYRLKVGTLPMNRVARAIERGETAGLMKVVIDADTDRLLGAAILGPEGGELIHVLMTLMWAGAPWTTLRHAVYIHPTLAEGFFALMEQV